MSVVAPPPLSHHSPCTSPSSPPPSGRCCGGLCKRSARFCLLQGWQPYGRHQPHDCCCRSMPANASLLLRDRAPHCQEHEPQNNPLAALQATLAADTTYFFIVDGFNGAYGIWQFSLAALDNSTVEGSLLSGSYGLAVPGTSSTSTTSMYISVSVPVIAKLLRAWQ